MCCEKNNSIMGELKGSGYLKDLDNSGMHPVVGFCDQNELSPC